MPEIALDDHVGHALPGRRRDGSRVKQLRASEQRLRARRMDVDPVMVGPHEGELDALIVFGVQVAALEAVLQKGAVVVIVPVKDKGVDAVFRGGFYFFGHHLWIGFILVAPQRRLWLLVTGESRPRVFDQLPLAPLFAETGAVSGVAGMVVWKIVGGDAIAGGVVRRRLLAMQKSQSQKEDENQCFSAGKH